MRYMHLHTIPQKRRTELAKTFLKLSDGNIMTLSAHEYIPIHFIVNFFFFFASIFFRRLLDYFKAELTFYDIFAVL